MEFEAEGVTVVVPIHGAFEDLRKCLASLLRHTAARHRIVLLNDASRDGRIWPYLLTTRDRETARGTSIAVMRHDRRRGYTATVNHGCRLAGEDNVVLLNSDTQVTQRWLEKLSATARSLPRVATVTPVSNAAGAFSVPVRNGRNPVPESLGVDGMARLVEEVSPWLCPQVPTGNGFCMLVRREALTEVGLFDEHAFPEGCGEENDFAMRASARGFVHLVDDRTFVFHRGSASLGWRKRWLVRRGACKLRRLYPEYERQVAAWLAADPLDELREVLAAALEREGAAA